MHKREELGNALTNMDGSPIGPSVCWVRPFSRVLSVHVASLLLQCTSMSYLHALTSFHDKLFIPNPLVLLIITNCIDERC